jgi:phosphate transport system permease protein
MTDIASDRYLAAILDRPKPSAEVAAAHTRRRYASEWRLKLYGLIAMAVAFGLLLLLIGTIANQGYRSFTQTFLRLSVNLDAAVIDPEGTRSPEALARADYQGLANQAITSLFPDATSRNDRRALRGLISTGAGTYIRDAVLADPSLIGTTAEIWVPANSNVDQYWKGYVDRSVPEADRKLSDRDFAWIDQLQSDGRLRSQFNRAFLFSGDSREPELAGLWGSLVGSFWLMVVTFALCVPVGIAAAVYLEEFAPQNRLTDLIEVNINNLAAVPSIVFGLLGLAVFLNTFGLPRSAPLVGGLTLALMSLPTIVVATRAALRAVPPSIRQAALGVGASKLQTVTHHVLPLALPGILTGAIIAMAQALGETAPLLMIGMNAFIVDIPHGPLDPASALPVQIYIWSDSPERAFAERTSGAILILLGFLILMNGLAVYLRKRLEIRW